MLGYPQYHSGDNEYSYCNLLWGMDKISYSYRSHYVVATGTYVMTVFPERSKTNKTVLVLKTPKTNSSVRKVFLPKTVSYQLIEWRKEQEKLKDILGSGYTDYNLVMATSYGLL